VVVVSEQVAAGKPRRKEAKSDSVGWAIDGKQRTFGVVAC